MDGYEGLKQCVNFKSPENACWLWKPLSEFYFRSDTGKFKNQCKECKLKYSDLYYNMNKEIVSLRTKKWRNANKDTVKIKKKKYYEDNKEELLIKAKEYRDENKEKIAEYKSEWYQENKEYKAEYDKQYREEHKEEKRVYLKDYVKKRLKNDPVFKLRRLFSTLIGYALRKQGFSKNGSSTKEFLPQSLEKTKKHIELLWNLPSNLDQNGKRWMSWNNYGKYNPKTHDINPTWTIDHIIPQSHLPYDNKDHPNVKICWANDNLRPFDARQNNRDGNRRTPEQIAAIKISIAEFLDKIKNIKDT